MAVARQDIILTAKADFSSVKRATADLANLSRGVSDFLKAGLGIGAGLQIATGAFASLRGGIRETLVEGVKFNASLEQSQLGIAAVLKQFNPQRYRNFQDALKDSAEAIDLLKQKALESPATFEALVGAFQGAAGAMVSAGIPLKKQVDLIVSMSQALAGLGIPEQQILQETRALITGHIDANAAAARILGITGEDISGAKAKGQLYEFLTSKISAFAEAAVLGSQSVNTLESNLKDAKTQVAADATKELTASYKDLLVALTNLVKSEGFKELFEGFANFAKGGVDAARAVSEFAALLASRDPVGTLENRAGELEKAAPEVRSQSDVEQVRRQAEVQMRVTQKLMSGLTRTVLDSPYGQRLNEVLVRYSAIVETLREKGAAQAQANRLLDEEARKADAVRIADEKAADEREKLLKELPELQKKADALNLAAMASMDRLAALRKNLAGKQDELSNAPTADHFLGSGAANASDEQKKQAQDAATAARLKIQNEIAGITKQIADTESEITKAAVRYLSVKAETGTVAEKIAAWEAEIAALDKQSISYQADRLTIEQRIARLRESEAARVRAEQVKDQERAYQNSLDRIREDRFLTERQKREILYTAFKREQAGIADRIRAAEDYAKTQPEGSATRAQAQGEVESLKQRRDVGLPRDLEANRPTTIIEDLKGGLADLVDSFRTIGQTIGDVVNTSLDSVSSNLTGLIMRTKTWTQALRDVGATILTSVVEAIVKASVQWIARKLIEFALGNTLRAAALAANAAIALSLSAIWAAPATLATIATYGGAAIAAPAEIGGALAVVQGMALFSEGGYTGPGGVNDPAGIVHRGEVVWSQQDVRRAGGVAAVEQMRISGRRPVEAGAGEVAAVESDNKRSLSLVLTTSELEATRIKKNSPAETQIVRIGNKRRHEIRY